MASYQGVYAKFVSMMSPKCSIVENDGELVLMALYKHFLPHYSAAIFSGVSTVFGFSRLGLSMDANFFHFFYKITNIRRSFSSSKIRSQFSYTFCNNTTIFKVMSQYFPALFKCIHNHIRSAEGSN